MKKIQASLDIIFSKYRILFVSISAFLLLIGALLGLNLYSSLQVGGGTATINASAYMRDLNQEITRDLFNLRLSYGEDPNTPHMKATINRLDNNMRRYEHNLNALIEGGTLIDADNDKIAVSARSLGESQAYLQQLEKEWRVIHPLILKYLKNARSVKASLTDLDLAVNQSQSSSIALANYTNKIATQIKREAYKQADLLTYLQIFGIFTIIVYFLIFIFFVLQRLMRSDADAEEARKETTEIMQTIREGLFLVDEDLRIGQQISSSLGEIFPNQKLQGENLNDVLSKIVNSKTMENSRRYFKQLFNASSDDALFAGINPLSRVCIYLNSQEELRNRFVSFSFNRVWEDDEVKRILVSVNDITEAVEMEQAFAKENKKHEQEMELLAKLLHISPSMLASFLRNADHLTTHINEILQRPESDVQNLKNKAREIFRDIHSFKGEASALNLDRFVVHCEEIEDCLKVLQKREKITGNDFMPVTISLDEIIECVIMVKTLQNNLQKNISYFKENSADDRNMLKNNIRQYYTNLANGVAQRNGKDVMLKIKRYEIDGLNDEKQDQIKEIIVQFIRNAVVHGIETPEERKAKNKDSMGKIIIDLYKDKDGHLQLIFADDGRGIDYDSLRKKIKKQTKYATQPEVVDQMPQDILNRFIFVSGISTAESNNIDAGRGVGMDVIRNRVHSLEGQINLSSVAQKGTKFVVTIP